MAKSVVIVTHYWAPHVGGIETVAAEQAHRLAGRGWNVQVFTSRFAGDQKVEHHGAVTVRRFASLNWQEEKLHVPVPLPTPRMATALLASLSEVGVVLAHGHVYPATAYAAWAARRRRTRLVVVQHSPFVSYPPVLEAVERLVDATLGRRVLERADHVVCVSRHTEQYVARIAPRAATSVLYSGVDTGRFAPGTADLAPTRLKVLTLRRLVPRNGVEVLIEAWQQAGLSQYADLMIGGDGALRSQLEERSRPDPGIRFLGRVAADDLANLYRSAALFVLPSVSGEGFGLVAAEALACGVPVITTDSGATGELVRNGIDGYVVPAQNYEALGNAIRSLLLDRSLRLRFARAAAERHKTLGWEKAIDGLERVLQVN